MDKDFLKEKKILLVGLGLHGGGVSTVQFLRTCHSHVRITDLKSKKELAPSLKQLGRIRGTFGCERLQDVDWADIIVKNPGVPAQNKLLLYAKKKKKIIVTDLSLFQMYLGRKFDIAVTGTRGKTTTAALIGHIVKGYKSRLFVAGNNRVPVLSVASAIKNQPIILELSSFQIEDATLRAYVAVFTTFYRDHLNRYKNIQAYFRSKAKLFLHQDKKDIAVLNYDDTRIRSLAKVIKSKRYFFSLHRLPKSVNGVYLKDNIFFFQNNNRTRSVFSIQHLKIFGTHNYQNVAAATMSAIAYGVPFSHIKKKVQTFSGVPYRLEKIKVLHGRVFINDTTATSPEALIAAYQSIRSLYKGKLHIIVGGADKKLDFSILRKIIKKSTVHFYPLAGTATKKMLYFLGLKSQKLYSSLQGALHDAWKNSAPGDVVLLSPGAASFGMFKHEFDRGEQFTQLVRKLS